MPGHMLPVLLCLSVVFHAIALQPRSGAVRYNTVDGTFAYVPSAVLSLGGVDNGKYPAHGHFSDWTNHPSGFGVLRINTSSLFSNRVQVMAAGYLEGYVTAERISDLFLSAKWMLERHVKDMGKMWSWMSQHSKWIKEETRRQLSGDNADPWWQALDLVLSQLDGLVAGYNQRVAEAGPSPDLDHISLLEFMMLNSAGDSGDLFQYLYPENQDDWSMLTPGEIRTRLALGGHCSVLIKVTGDLSDLIVGHVTWTSYALMSRIYKHYNFALQGDDFASGQLSFSSYPGMISSLDDWYTVGGRSKMIVTETTNDVLDDSIYEGHITPQSALTWQRVRVANMLAGNGPEWASHLARLNSATYNNQYMIIDLKLFTPGRDLVPGLLTIAEQMPGDVVYGDATQELERGHWPSYNVPYFPEVYNRTGYTALAAKLARRGGAYESAALAGLSYQLAPRAKIFRRDQGAVKDLAGLKAILRYNKFKTDPYSSGSVWDAICARGDLNTTHPVPAGCTDAKVTSYRLALQMGSEVINGPPRAAEVAGYDQGDLPAFDWSNTPLKNVVHHGQPDSFRFTYEVMKP